MKRFFKIATFVLVSALFIEAIYVAFHLINMPLDGAVIAGVLIFVAAIISFASFLVATVINPLLQSINGDLK